MTRIPKGSQIGRYPYRVLRQLGAGEGGMSLIYLATTGDVDAPRLEELVALKIANVDTEHRNFYEATLDNEVEHLRRFRHRGIVRLYPILGEGLPPNPIYSAQTILPGKPWFSVMEYLSGGSLAELLKRHRKMDVGLALRIVQMLAETLAYIHQQGHVHLDIKPENVVFRHPINQGIEPVLVDFGIARALGQEGLEAGTLQWSPPERIINSESKNLPPELMAKPHPSMDVYALGLLLYRMVAGRLPFEGSRKSVTSAILQGNPTRPSSYEAAVENEVDRIVLTALAKNPAARPTAHELAEMVGSLASDPKYRAFSLPTQSASPPSESKERGSPRMRWALPAMIPLVAIGLLLFLWVGNGGTVALTTATPTPSSTVEATRTATAPPATRRATPSPTPRASATEGAIRRTSTPVPTYTSVPPSPGGGTPTP